MTNENSEKPRSSTSGPKSQSDTEFSQAMNRLEKAVQDLVSVTAGELGGRATSLIDETSKRLEAELRLKKASGNDPEQEERQARRHRRRRYRHRFEQRRRRRLVLDRENEKIAGVCAGLAPYLGVEVWMVRLAAVTGLLFVPHIVFPAYWISYFVMEKPDPNDPSRSESSDEEFEPTEAPDSRSERRKSRRRRRRAAREGYSKAAAGPAAQAEFNPRRSLRYARTDVTQAELRLRRLESFVTSKQYELQKELHQIEKETNAHAH